MARLTITASIHYRWKHHRCPERSSRVEHAERDCRRHRDDRRSHSIRPAYHRARIGGTGTVDLDVPEPRAHRDVGYATGGANVSDIDPTQNAPPSRALHGRGPRTPITARFTGMTERRYDRSVIAKLCGTKGSASELCGSLRVFGPSGPAGPKRKWVTERHCDVTLGTPYRERRPMRRVTVRTLVAVIFTAALVACGKSSASPNPLPHTVDTPTLTGESPSSATVAMNGAPCTVTWSFQGVAHTVTWDSQPPGAVRRRH